MENADQVKVEVAYSQPGHQTIIPVDIEKGMTLHDAINLSGVLDQFPGIDLAKNKVGVFGKLAKLDRELRPGDRVEIYRALIADPKEVRRRRAAEAKAKASKEESVP
ncbi:MAG: RnfH family protein [Gammaproteobacteria bacterium]|nr:RnfH family protein [Gammaproteobacteria bacterium]